MSEDDRTLNKDGEKRILSKTVFGVWSFEKFIFQQQSTANSEAYCCCFFLFQLCLSSVKELKIYITKNMKTVSEILVGLDRFSPR